MQISCFRNFKGKTPESSTLEAMAEYIRSDRSLAQITALYRRDGSKQIKEESPMFAVAATFCGGKSKADITAMTGLSLVDLDHVEPERLSAIRKAAVSDPHTLLCYTTISGRGLRVIFRYEIEKSYDLKQQLHFYGLAFAYGNEYYSRLLGVEADLQCKNVNRLSGLAHDPEVFFNPDAVAFTSAEIMAAGRAAQAQSRTGKRIPRIQEFFDRVIAPRLDADGIVYRPGSHNDYVMRTGYMLARRHFNRQASIEWAKAKFSDYDGTEQVMQSCFNSFGARSDGGARQCGDATDIAGINDITAFLDDHIRLRLNDISDRIEYLLPDQPDPSDTSYTSDSGIADDDKWQPFGDRTLNTLWADMSHTFRVRKDDINNVVNSTYTPHFNPITEFLDHLPPWHDGDTDYIRELADTVKVKSDGGALTFYDALRKWMVAMVASWIGDSTVNHVILVLIGEQGAFKTTWFQYLLPPELRRYFYPKINVNRMTRDEMVYLSRYALMCYEELDCMSSADLNRLKGIVTMEHVDEREPYARYPEHRPHIASFCGTGNNPQFLSDPTGNRRWLPFEVESITSPRDHPLNYRGIYSQAYALLQGGFRYYFSPEEIKIQNMHNREFEAPNMELELVGTYFRRPNEGEIATFMTASRALQQIGGSIAQKLSVVRIGRAFKELGFSEARSQGVRGYWVMERSPEEMRLYLRNVTPDS